MEFTQAPWAHPHPRLCPRYVPSARPCPGVTPATRAPTSCNTCSTGTSSPTTPSWWVTRLPPALPSAGGGWVCRATRGLGTLGCAEWAPHPQANQLSSLGGSSGGGAIAGAPSSEFALRPGDTDPPWGQAPPVHAGKEPHPACRCSPPVRPQVCSSRPLPACRHPALYLQCLPSIFHLL